MKGGKKPDWLKIRLEYETTEISQRKLAEKHGVSFPTLRDRAKREEWIKTKEETRNKIITVTSQKTVEKIAEDISDIDNLHYETWKAIHEVLKNVVEAGKEFMPAKDIMELAGAMEKIQKGQRLASNIIDAATKEKIKLEREKLQLMKDKDNPNSDEIIHINLPQKKEAEEDM